MEPINEVKQTFQEFLEQVIGYEIQRRRGQALHNLLAQVRPRLWEAIRDGILDPIDDDTRIEACLNWLEENW